MNTSVPGRRVHIVQAVLVQIILLLGVHLCLDQALRHTAYASWELTNENHLTAFQAFVFAIPVGTWTLAYGLLVVCPSIWFARKPVVPGYGLLIQILLTLLVCGVLLYEAFIPALLPAINYG